MITPFLGEAITMYCVISPESMILIKDKYKSCHLLASSKLNSRQNHVGFSFHILADKSENEPRF